MEKAEKMEKSKESSQDKSITQTEKMEKMEKSKESSLDKSEKLEKPKIDKSTLEKSLDKADRRKDVRRGATERRERPKSPKPNPRPPDAVAAVAAVAAAVARTKRKSTKKPPTKKHPKSFDGKPLEEFLHVMDQWYKSSRTIHTEGTGPDDGTSTHRDPRSFAESAGKAVMKFLSVNNLGGDRIHEMTYLEAARMTSQSVAEEAGRILERVKSNRQALGIFSSAAQLVRQFLHTFVVFYHTLAGDHPIHTVPLLGEDYIAAHVKAAYENLEDDLGWSLEEEFELYRSLPIRGEFPPPDYRSSNYEEMEQKILPDFARPAEERLHTLPALLRRFQGELAFRSTLIHVPEVDINSLHSRVSKTGTPAAAPTHHPLLSHIATEYSKIYGFDWRGGNLFAAIRGSLCFLLHAQTVLDVLSTVPLFRPLVTTARPLPVPSRHSLDLMRNLHVASSHQANKPAVTGTTTSAGTGTTTGGAAGTADLAFIRKRTVLMTYDDGRTVGDMVRELENRPALQCSTRTDLVHAFVAMFFDAPFSAFRKNFENRTHAMQVVQPPFFPASLQFAPLFVHNDVEFLSEYFVRNPTSEYSQAFLAPSLKPISKKEEKSTELMDLLRSSGGHGLILSRVSGKGDKETLAPIPISPHRYPTESASLFSLSEEVPQAFLETSHLLEALGPLEKGELLATLLRQSSGPDDPCLLNGGSEPSLYEEKSINYVNKRNISAGIFEMLRDTLRSLNSYASPFYQQQEITTHIEELTGRLTSLMLGYTHAFAPEERPKDKMFLDIDLIIPFLYRYRQAILDPAKQKQPILGLEFEFFKSPLVLAIFRLARGWGTTKSQLGGLGDPHSLINQLYSLWEDSKIDPHALHDLHHLIIKILSPLRYDQEQLREALRAATDSLETSAAFLTSCERHLAAFEVFLNANEGILGDPNVVVPVGLCPGPIVQAESGGDVEDAQVPAEIF